MNALQKYVAKTKLASALSEKLASNPTGMPTQPKNPGFFAKMRLGLRRLANMPSMKQRMGLKPMPKAWQGTSTVKSRAANAPKIVPPQTQVTGR